MDSFIDEKKPCFIETLFIYLHIYLKQRIKNYRKMNLIGYTYQPKQTQGGKPSVSGMLYSGSDELS